MSLTKLRRDAMQIFEAGLKAVDAGAAVRSNLVLKDKRLSVGNRNFHLDNFENIYVIGFGKAAAVMAANVEDILGDLITAGIIVTKYGHAVKLEKIKTMEAGHPVPDDAGMVAAQSILNLVNQADGRDLVICLISGGGSALLPWPAGGISLRDKQEVTTMLLASGASIDELNAVRKHLSGIKGGQLARAAYPATLVTLALSDVVDDRADVIASGPTVPDPSTFEDVWRVLNRYEVWNELPPGIQKHVGLGRIGTVTETAKPGDAIFATCHFVIIGSNTIAIDAAKVAAEKLGYQALILSSCIEGETHDIARMHAALGKEMLASGNPLAPPACLISGGETTVTLRGSGKGGRNQEFCLAAANDIAGKGPIVILSAGTDGTDGPTDAAGAICDSATVARAAKLNMDGKKFLFKNDAYNYFKPLDDLIITGPTNTNVMDLRLILVGEN